MKTDKMPIFNLFEKQRRYLVPIFQRGYVWTKDGQWSALWEDIAEQAEVVKARNHDPKETEKKHFLGAIVLSQVPTMVREIQASQIIDGQQRLLTLQVFLAALRDVVNSLNDDFLKSKLSQLTANNGPFTNPDEVCKVWPTNGYQEDFKNVMQSNSPVALAAKYPQQRRRGKMQPEHPRLVQAYLFFHDCIVDHLNSDDDDNGSTPANITDELKGERASVLVDTIMYNVQLVTIELDSEDDPQVIFETLNATGVPLEPSDLIRNFIFLYASRKGEDTKALYSQRWIAFEETNGIQDKFWKEQTKQGRLKRSRLDLFFFHYLTYLTGNDIKIGHLYQEFKNWWEEEAARSVDEELCRIINCSLIFRYLLTSDDDDPMGVLARRLRILDTSTVYPMLLWLGERRPDINEQEFSEIMKDMESYLIRRAVCKLTTKNYNRIFATMLSKLSKAGLPALATIRQELLGLTGDSGIWPNDELFRQHLIFDPLYTSFGKKETQMLLLALEKASLGSKQENVQILDHNLTIEHVMPQSAFWEHSNYPFPPSSTGDLSSQQARRGNSIHSLGNLTLVTQPLNSSVSNGPFREKQSEICSQSLLKLNSYFQTLSDNTKWDEATIETRGRQLADLAIHVWAYPNA